MVRYIYDGCSRLYASLTVEPFCIVLQYSLLQNSWAALSFDSDCSPIPSKGQRRMKFSIPYLLLQTAAGATALPQTIASAASIKQDQSLKFRAPRSLSTSLLAPFTPLVTGQWPQPESYNLSSWQPTDNWRGLTTDHSNPYRSAPFTGAVRRYDFTISRGRLAPDGVEKDMILVNGQFPGPPIKADWGDWIQVTVRNQITGPDEVSE